MSSMLYIICPNTKQRVPTGIMIDSQSKNAVDREKARMRCPECGDEHAWTPQEATYVQPPVYRP